MNFNVSLHQTVVAEGMKSLIIDILVINCQLLTLDGQSRALKCGYSLNQF